jgi:hypothetical protein
MADDVLIEGRSSDQARKLIEKAQKAGIDPSLIRTTSKGYLVPAELAEDKADTKATEKPAKAAAKRTAKADNEGEK